MVLIKKLSILIPTLPEREAKLKTLLAFLKPQLNHFVEIIIDDTAKEAMSIGNKRNELYKKAIGTYSVQIDDDDLVPDNYIHEVLKALDNKPDCVGYLEDCMMDGIKKLSIISIACQEWSNGNRQTDGFDYLRTPFFKTPIKTELCEQVGVADMRFGEDHDFAKRIYPLLKKEEFINKIMYYYSANSLTPEQHQERYGITG